MNNHPIVPWSFHSQFWTYTWRKQFVTLSWGPYSSGVPGITSQMEVHVFYYSFLILDLTRNSKIMLSRYNHLDLRPAILSSDKNTVSAYIKKKKIYFMKLYHTLIIVIVIIIPANCVYLKFWLGLQKDLHLKHYLIFNSWKINQWLWDIATIGLSRSYKFMAVITKLMICISLHPKLSWVYLMFHASISFLFLIPLTVGNARYIGFFF